MFPTSHLRPLVSQVVLGLLTVDESMSMSWICFLGSTQGTQICVSQSQPVGSPDIFFDVRRVDCPLQTRCSTTLRVIHGTFAGWKLSSSTSRILAETRCRYQTEVGRGLTEVWKREPSGLSTTWELSRGRPCSTILDCRPLDVSSLLSG